MAQKNRQKLKSINFRMYLVALDKNVYARVKLDWDDLRFISAKTPSAKVNV